MNNKVFSNIYSVYWPLIINMKVRYTGQNDKMEVKYYLIKLKYFQCERVYFLIKRSHG